jgi:hypothetical protein
MIGLVYFCKGKLKGYLHPITITDVVKDQHTFVKNMVEEGARQEDNITAASYGAGLNWTCIVFDEAGKPIWHYVYESMEGKLFKVHVEQTEGA